MKVFLIFLFCFSFSVGFSQLIANFSVDDPLCAGSEVSFSDISFGPNQVLSRQWFVDDVLLGTDSVFSWFFPVGTGTVVVKLTVDDGFGPSSKESTLSFYTLPDVIISATGYSTGVCGSEEAGVINACPSQTIELSASGAGSYSWINDEMVFAGSTNVEIVPIEATNTEIVLSGTDFHGCVNFDTIVIYGLNTFALFSNIDICEGDSALIDHPIEDFWVSESDTFSVSYLSECECDSLVTFYVGVHPKIFVDEYFDICSGDSIFWEGNWYKDEGLYQVWLTSVFGCDSVRQLHLNEHAGFTDTLISTLCVGDTLLWQGDYYWESGFYQKVFATQYGCDSVLNLQLDVNESFYQNDEVSVCGNEGYLWDGISYFESGFYTHSYTTASGCDSIYTLDLTVFPKPDPWLGNDTLICYYDNIILNPGAFDSYTWIFGSNSSEYEIDGNVTGTGIFMVWVIVENEFGCSDSDTIIVTVDWCAGIENEEKGLKIFPNPAGEVLSVDFTQQPPISYSIINSSGLIVKIGYLNSNSKKIDLRNLEDGFYFIEIKAADQIIRSRFIKAVD